MLAGVWQAAVRCLMNAATLMRHRLPNPQAHPSAGVTITLWALIINGAQHPTYVTPEVARCWLVCGGRASIRCLMRCGHAHETPAPPSHGPIPPPSAGVTTTLWALTINYGAHSAPRTSHRKAARGPPPPPPLPPFPPLPPPPPSSPPFLPPPPLPERALSVLPSRSSHILPEPTPPPSSRLVCGASGCPVSHKGSPSSIHETGVACTSMARSCTPVPRPSRILNHRPLPPPPCSHRAGLSCPRAHRGRACGRPPRRREVFVWLAWETLPILGISATCAMHRAKRRKVRSIPGYPQINDASKRARLWICSDASLDHLIPTEGEKVSIRPQHRASEFWSPLSEGTPCKLPRYPCKLLNFSAFTMSNACQSRAPETARRVACPPPMPPPASISRPPPLSPASTLAGCAGCLPAGRAAAPSSPRGCRGRAAPIAPRPPGAARSKARTRREKY